MPSPTQCGTKRTQTSTNCGGLPPKRASTNIATRERDMERLPIIALVATVSAFLWIGDLVVKKAQAQEHQHQPADRAIHDEFYSKWMMPDNRDLPCCNLKDCYPTRVRHENGVWWALRREDKRWVKIPPHKVEEELSSPDGRSHLCAAPPHPTGRDFVFCFIAGGGM